ncbi:MAG: ComEA family DNA-binding protein [Sinomonas sp.]|nr:ComEA family DNA-binding protein [Sinomonas sp.]
MASDPNSPGRKATEGRRRWALSRGLAAMVTIVLLACTGLWWWSEAARTPAVRPVDESPSDGPASSTPSSPLRGSPAADDGARRLVVHVTGAVASPGVYRLSEGSRVQDAVSAAGGALPGAEPDRLNLAAPLEDGVRLVVPRPGEDIEPSSGGPSASVGAGATSASSSAKLNLNRAGVEELESLPRVGRVLAQRIVDHRTQHGRFSSVDALVAVAGIGTRMLESLRPYVFV